MTQPPASSRPPSPVALSLRNAAPPLLDRARIAELRSLGDVAAGRVVAAQLDEGLRHPRARRAAVEAALLARELRLAPAVPSLVECVRRLPDADPLALAAADAVATMGDASVDELLAAYERCSTAEERERLVEVLARTRIADDRILAALQRLLDDTPEHAAFHLIEYGDPRALPALFRALDRAAPHAADPDSSLAGGHVLTLGMAIEALGGTLGPSQDAKVAEAARLRDEVWRSDPLLARLLPDPVSPAPAPGTGPSRPDRNAPCHCGSGKKYKKCHLAADERR